MIMQECINTDLTLNDLSEREKDVAVKISEGYTYGEIGMLLNISHQTAKNYGFHLTKKLNVKRGKPCIMISKWVWEQLK